MRDRLTLHVLAQFLSSTVAFSTAKISNIKHSISTGSVSAYMQPSVALGCNSSSTLTDCRSPNNVVDEDGVGDSGVEKVTARSWAGSVVAFPPPHRG